MTGEKTEVICPKCNSSKHVRKAGRVVSTKMGERQRYQCMSKECSGYLFTLRPVKKEPELEEI